MSSMKKTLVVFLTLFAFMSAQAVTLSYGDVDLEGGTAEIYMQNSEPVFGFQFTMENLMLTGASGGLAQTAGFMISTNESGLVLGFSLIGSSIPAGEGVLTTLTFDGLLDDSMPICYSAATISGDGGVPLDVDFSACYPEVEELDPPYNLVATGGDNEIALTWQYDAPAREDVHLAVTNYDAGSGQLEIWMENQIPVGGFQFDLESSFPDFIVTGASGGSAQSSGFMVSTNESGLILGFSLTGATIAAGEGVLCYADVQFTGENGNFYVDAPTLSDSGGSPLSYTLGDPYWIGEMPVEITYNVYRDGTQIATGLDMENYVDSGLGAGETHCYTVTAFDGSMESPHSNEDCATTNSGVEGVLLSIGEVVDDVVTITMQNSEEVAGFQFTMFDNPDILDTGTGYGGISQQLGFMVSTNSEGLVLGFSITGATIPVGSHDLVFVPLENITGDFTVLSLGEAIISDTEGDPLDVIYGDPFTIGTPPEVPDAPGGLAAELVSANTVGLSWNASDGADFYTVYRDGAPLDDTTDLDYTDAGLAYNTEYHYFVTASNISGESEQSDAVHITTGDIPFEAYPPENLTAEGGDAIVHLEWQEPIDPNIYEEGFEDGDIPADWENVDDDGDGESWFAYTYAPHSGTYSLASASWTSTMGPLNPDNYLIAPAMNPTNGSMLSYWVAAQDAAYAEDHIEVWVSTTGTNISDFNTEIDGYTPSAGDDSWHERTVDLSEFAGETIYLAFRHTDTYDMFYIKIDDVSVTGLMGGLNFHAGFENAADFDQFTVRSSAADYPVRVEGVSDEELALIIEEYNQAHPSVTERVLTGYNVYRGDMSGGPYTLVGSTAADVLEYDDVTVENDNTYYYVVTSVHDDGLVESDYSNEAMATPEGLGPLPPMGLTATGGNGFIDLEWMEPAPPEEIELAYWEGTLQNAFYFYDTFEAGFCHGTKFDVGGPFDVVAASVKILSAGDQYWPWPNDTHGPVRVIVLADDGGMPGDVLYDAEAVAEDGWATVYPNLMGLEGTFYVVSSHTLNWSTGGDAEGYGIDGSVDFPDNMVTMQEGAWSTGDPLGYGGDYMFSAVVNAFGATQTLGYFENNMPETPALDLSVANSVHDGTAPLAGTVVTYPNFVLNEMTRELQGYNIYRDDVVLDYVNAGTETYRDEAVVNLTEYCYYVTAEYDEGESDPSNIACATPAAEEANPPRNLVATGNDGMVGLEWDAPVGGPVGDEIEEGFESGDVPEDWANVDDDGDGEMWFGYTYEPHTGTYAIASASWTSTGGPLNPDNYLITPALDASATTELTYWVAAQDPAYAEDHIEVWISTTGMAPANFTDEVDGYTPPAGDDSWYQRTVDLSAYAGQTIYIAFRHTDSYDMFYIKLDDIMVTGLAGGQTFASSFESVSDLAQFTVRSSHAEYPVKTDGELYGYELAQLIDEYNEDHINTRVLTGYNLYRGTMAGGPYTYLDSTDPATLFYDDLNVTNGTTYYYVATATYSEAPESEYSNEAMATPEAFVPNPPLNLVAEAGDSEVDLSWDPPQGGGPGGWPPCPDPTYQYVDCAGTCFNNEDCADGTYDGCVDGENTWLGDGFCDDGTYGLVLDCEEYFWDMGDCEEDPGECESLDEFDVVPNGCYENSNAFSLSWNDGCTLTALYYGENDVTENFFDLTGMGMDSGINFYGFGPNETYMFMIEAGDVQSPIVTATSSDDDCGTPFGPTVAWLDPADLKHFTQGTERTDREELTGYNVYRGTSSGSYDPTPIGTTMDEFFTDEFAVNGTMYYYVVTAVYDNILESDYSNEASAMPLPFEPDPPTELTAEAGDEMVSLEWVAPSSGGTGEGWPPCPDPTYQYVDCAGTCFNNEDCIDGTYDGCVDGDNTWLGDGFCDDGTYGLVLDCEEYFFDMGDCVDPGDCESLDEFDVQPNGCYEGSNAFSLSWNAGCTLTALYYGEADVTENFFDLTGMGMDSGINFYGFGPNETYMFMIEAGDIQSPVVTATSSDDDCGTPFGGPTVAWLDPADLKHFNQGTERTERDVLTGYNLYRGFVSGGPYFPIASDLDPELVTYVDNDVMNGMTYYYVVSAVFDGNNESDYSNEASATPMSTVMFTIPDASVMGGETVTVDVGLTNDEPVGGVQFDLTDVPNYLTLTGVEGTARVPADWMLQGQELTNGDGRVLGFSLQGTLIEPGDGPILTLTFDTMIPSEPADVNLCTTAEVISDAAGQGYFVTSGCGTVTLTVESIEVFIETVTEAVDQGGMVDISVDVNNPVAFYGMELHIADVPEVVTTVNVTPTERIPDQQMFSFSEIDGELTVLWFSMTLTPVEIGSGELFTISYEVNGDAPDGTADLVLTETSVFSDMAGASMYHTAFNGSLAIGLPDVYVSLVQTGSGMFDVIMNNNGPVSGFQIDITDDPDYYTFFEAAATPRVPTDWMISGSENNGNFRILGFSLSGTQIPAGEGAILQVTANLSMEEFTSILCFETATISDPNADPYYTVTECAEFIEPPGGGCEDPETLVVEIPPTGESSLIVISDVFGEGVEIENCDEIGLYDAAAITNSGDCSNQIGELLVGSAVWNGEQIEIVGIGSLDYCAYGGFQYPGYVAGNEIVFKYYDVSEDMLYTAVPDFSAGNGEWGSLITAATLTVIGSYTQEVELQANFNNMISFNVMPEAPAAETIFGDDIFIGWDDQGQYYVPSYNVDQIGDINYLAGYKVFATEPVTLEVTGLPVDLMEAITWNPFMVNMFSFTPQAEMAALDAFEDYDDDILIISNDEGEFYVPSLGVETLTMLYPGKCYTCFLDTDEPVDFYYPMDTFLSRGPQIEAVEQFKEASISQQYDVVKTGMPYAIVLTEVDGYVSEGDEVAAYADGEVVGATRIVDLSQPVTIAAWAGYNEYGLELPGYEAGEAIELRVWSASEGKELRFETDLNNYYYEGAALTYGSGTAYNMDAVPSAFTLSQNYPNPFNPATSIDFSVPADSKVSMKVYDLTGRLVTTLVNGNMTAGYHTVMWNGTDMNGQPVSAGLYIYTLQTDSDQMSSKMVLMK